MHVSSESGRLRRCARRRCSVEVAVGASAKGEGKVERVRIPKVSSAMPGLDNVPAQPEPEAIGAK
eukprot:7665287-Alexandrium_andersonii.AAC.1